MSRVRAGGGEDESRSPPPPPGVGLVAPSLRVFRVGDGEEPEDEEDVNAFVAANPVRTKSLISSSEKTPTLERFKAVASSEADVDNAIGGGFLHASAMLYRNVGKT